MIRGPDVAQQGPTNEPDTGGENAATGGPFGAAGPGDGGSVPATHEAGATGTADPSVANDDGPCSARHAGPAGHAAPGAPRGHVRPPAPPLPQERGRDPAQGTAVPPDAAPTLPGHDVPTGTSQDVQASTAWPAGVPAAHTAGSAPAPGRSPEGRNCTKARRMKHVPRRRAAKARPKGHPPRVWDGHRRAPLAPRAHGQGRVREPGATAEEARAARPHTLAPAPAPGPPAGAVGPNTRRGPATASTASTPRGGPSRGATASRRKGGSRSRHRWRLA